MKKIVERLDQLASEGSDLLREVHAAPMGSDDGTLEQAISKWYRDCETILAYAGLTDHVLQVQTTSPDTYPRDPYRIAAVAGLVASARDTVDGGFLVSLKQLVHADFVDGVAEQAVSLLDAGHKIPAAVLGRVALEGWLRTEAERHEIDDFESVSASRLNDELKKCGAFSTTRWRQIQAHLDVGNAAAHGRESDFTKEDVRGLLAFVAAIAT